MNRLTWPARLLASLALAATLLTSAPAHAVDFDFGLTGGFEYHVSRGLPELSDDRLTPTGGPNLGMWFTPWLGVGLQYRFLDLERSSWDLNSHTIEASLRTRFCLTSWLQFVGDLAFEVQVTRLKAYLYDGLQLSQTAPGFGFQPRVGLEVSLPVEGTFELRAGAMLGFAFRTGLAFDAMEPDGNDEPYDYEGPAYTVKPVDVGVVNLTGLTLGVTLGGRF